MEDLISNLPDAILFHILSCLPFPSAIQTLLLSKRWRLLWQTALVQHGTTEDVSRAVSGFLNHFNERDPSRNTRKLQFHFGNAAVLFATIGPNNKLYLNFSNGNQEFPRQFGLQLEFNHQTIIAKRPPLSGIHSFGVKDLHLISVTHLTNEAVSSIVSEFQFLETLKITGCNGLQTLSIGSHTGLKNLIIFYCSQLESLHLGTSKLRTFRYRGTLPWIRPENHYNLADAMLDCREGPSNSYFTLSGSDFDPVLLTIKNATALTLCKWTFKALISPSLSTFLAQFQFYNLKELWWIDDLGERYDSGALLCFLKLCPSLEQLFITIDPGSYAVETTDTFSIQAGKNTKLGHLKLVKLEGFPNQVEEMLLMERLREIITSEPLILASSLSSSDDESSLRRLRNAPLHESKSTLGQMGAQDSKRFYEFVEVEDTSEMCPKHVHMGL